MIQDPTLQTVEKLTDLGKPIAIADESIKSADSHIQEMALEGVYADESIRVNLGMAAYYVDLAEDALNRQIERES